MSPSPQPPTSILLLGAGELGSAILTSIASHPLLSSVPLTIALRPASLDSPSRLDSLRALLPAPRQPALSFAPLDLAAPTAASDLTALILSGAHDAVVACTGMTTSGTDAGTQTLITRAVLAAGRQRAQDARPLRFFPWQFGVDYDAIGPDAAGGLMREQCGVRTILRREAAGAGVAWTIVSTGVFVSFVFEERFGVVEGLGRALKAGGPEPLADEGVEVVVRGLGGWGNAVSVTDVRDIGRVVAECLARPVEEDGNVVFTAGETVTYGEVAEVVQRVIGRRKEVRREEWSVEFLKGELEKDPESQMKKYRLLFAEGTGVSWDMGKTLNAQRGIDMVGVEQWLREQLSM